jgi:hypothetical protein
VGGRAWGVRRQGLYAPRPIHGEWVTWGREGLTGGLGGDMDGRTRAGETARSFVGERMTGWP